MCLFGCFCFVHCSFKFAVCFALKGFQKAWVFSRIFHPSIHPGLHHATVTMVKRKMPRRQCLRLVPWNVGSTWDVGSTWQWHVRNNFQNVDHILWNAMFGKIYIDLVPPAGHPKISVFRNGILPKHYKKMPFNSSLGSIGIWPDNVTSGIEHDNSVN